MRDYLFFDFLFDNSLEFLIYLFTICILLFLLSKKTVGYILDPFHFYYTFTFGTSYAVILLLYIHDYIPDDYFSYLLISNVVFFVSYSLSSIRRSKHAGLFIRLGYSIRYNERFILQLLWFIYFAMLLIYLSKVSIAGLLLSRFDANKGLGPIVRIMDALRLIIAAWMYINYIRLGKKKYLIIALVFSCVSAFFSGAKFALLEQMYVMFVAGFVGERIKIKLHLKTIVLAGVFLVALFLFILFMLQKLSDGIGYQNSQYIPGAPVTLELFILRILANGDSYYLSLTQRVLDDININFPVLQFFSNVFGNSFMSRLFGQDFSNGDIGRQIWLYWYPDDDIMRGPTAHFDISGLVYFGYIGGVIFSIVIGVVLGSLNKLKYSCYHAPTVIVAFVSALYCRSLPLMLNPSVGLAYIVDIYMLLFLLLVLSTLSRKRIG